MCTIENVVLHRLVLNNGHSYIYSHQSSLVNCVVGVSHIANAKKLLYTVVNPAPGLQKNRGKKSSSTAVP